MIDTAEIIERNLLCILAEVASQVDIGDAFPTQACPFVDQVFRLKEWIEQAGEYGIAYESLVVMLEMHPFKLSSKAAIKLLEVGLLIGYKTERPEDLNFDKR